MVGHTAKARATAWSLIYYGIAVGVVIGVALGIGHHQYALMFTKDNEVVQYAAQTLPVLAVLTPLASISYVLDGVMIGAAQFTYMAVAMALCTTERVRRHQNCVDWLHCSTERDFELFRSQRSLQSQRRQPREAAVETQPQQQSYDFQPKNRCFAQATAEAANRAGWRMGCVPQRRAVPLLASTSWPFRTVPAALT